MRGSCNPRAVSHQPHCVSLCTSQGRTCHCSGALSWQSQQQPGPQEPTSPRSKWKDQSGPWMVMSEREKGTGHMGKENAVSLCAPSPSTSSTLAERRQTDPKAGNTCEEQACRLPSPTRSVAHLPTPVWGGWERSFSFQGALTPEKNTCSPDSLMPHVLLQADPAPQNFYPMSWHGVRQIKI